MPILNYQYSLVPTPAQAHVLDRAMRLMGWGWNLMVRSATRSLRVIRRGSTGVVQRCLAQHIARRGMIGRRASQVHELMRSGIGREEAEAQVVSGLTTRAYQLRGTGLAMELAIAEAEFAKQGLMGSANGAAWSQVGIKYRRAWEGFWDKRALPPKKKRVRNMNWLQVALQGLSQDYLFRFPELPVGQRDNWVDLSRFFPVRLTRLPRRIHKANVRDRERLKSEFRRLSEVRFIQHRPLPAQGELRDMKVIRTHTGSDAKWFLILAVDVPAEVSTKVFPVTGKACGINPARRHALTICGEDHLGSALPGIAGEEDGPGRPLARVQRKLARLQRRQDRQRRVNNPQCFDERGRWIKGQRLVVTTKRMVKTESQIRTLFRRVSNQRKEAFHRIAENLLKRYDVVYLGDWKPEAPRVRRAKNKARLKANEKVTNSRAKGMAILERLGNRMDQEASLGGFRRILFEKVARSAGLKKLVPVPEPYTTQACAKCQALTGPKGFGPQGWWTCSGCGYRQLRHRTAAYNILQDGPKAEIEQSKGSELGPESADPTPQTPPAGGKGARQALKGGGDPTVGRMPSKGGEGALASRPARNTRKGSTPAASAAGLSAPIRAQSLVTSSGGRGVEEGASRTATPGETFGSTAGTARVGLRESQDP